MTSDKIELDPMTAALIYGSLRNSSISARYKVHKDHDRLSLLEGTTMIQRIPIILLSLVMLFVPSHLFGATFPEKPPTEHYYVDKAELIDPEAREQIDRTAEALLAEERIPLYVVTIPSLSSQDALTLSIEQYATALFDHWGIGFQDRNYGILLLISRGDRKARIELGADWGREYDHQARQIMDELIVPAFKREDFSTGISDGVRGLDAMARGLELPKAKPPWWYWPALIGSLVLIIALIINLFRTGRTGWAWALIAALGFILVYFFRAMTSGSDSDDDSDDGSGGGFSGGSSGGGGATGSW